MGGTGLCLFILTFVGLRSDFGKKKGGKGREINIIIAHLALRLIPPLRVPTMFIIHLNISSFFFLSLSEVLNPSVHLLQLATRNKAINKAEPCVGARLVDHSVLRYGRNTSLPHTFTTQVHMTRLSLWTFYIIANNLSLSDASHRLPSFPSCSFVDAFGV